MDVHREGGRREDDDGDVVVDATRTMRRWKMRMTAPSVYEERQIDASKNTSLLSIFMARHSSSDINVTSLKLRGLV